MFVTKCNRCKKEITESRGTVRVSADDQLSTIHLCPSCAKPIMAVLKRLRLLTRP